MKMIGFNSQSNSLMPLKRKESTTSLSRPSSNVQRHTVEVDVSKKITSLQLKHAIAKQLELPVSNTLYIESYDQFIQLTHDVALTETKYFRNTRGHLECADRSNNNPICLVLDYAKIKPDERHMFNTVWDGEHPALTELNSYLHIVGVRHPNSQKLGDPSIRGRLDKEALLRLDEPRALDATLSINTETISEFLSHSSHPHIAAQCHKNLDFEGLLLGGPQYLSGEIFVEPGALIRALEAHVPLVIHNPPTPIDALHEWLKEIVLDGVVYFNNRFYPVPDSFNVTYVEGYDPNAIANMLSALTINAQPVLTDATRYLVVTENQIDELLSGLHVESGCISLASVIDDLETGDAVVLSKDLSQESIHRICEALSNLPSESHIAILAEPGLILPKEFGNVTFQHYLPSENSIVSNVVEWDLTESTTVIDMNGDRNIYSQVLSPIQVDSFQRFKGVQTGSDILDALDNGDPIVITNWQRNPSITHFVKMLAQPRPQVLVNGRLKDVPHAKIIVASSPFPRSQKSSSLPKVVRSLIQDTLNTIKAQSLNAVSLDMDKLTDMIEKQAQLEATLDHSPNILVSHTAKAIRTTVAKLFRDRPNTYQRTKDSIDSMLLLSASTRDITGMEHIRDVILAGAHTLHGVSFKTGLDTCMRAFCKSVASGKIDSSERLLIDSFLNPYLTPDPQTQEVKVPEELVTLFRESLKPEVQNRQSFHKYQRRLYRLSQRFKTHRLNVILGPAATGKSRIVHEIVKAIGGRVTQYNAGPTTTQESLVGDLKTFRTREGDTVMKFEDGPLAKWAKDTTPGLKVLLIDESNLAKEGTYDFLSTLLNNPPYVVINGHQIQLTQEHTIVLTGNPMSYEGRVEDPFILSAASPTQFKELSDDFIRFNVIEPLMPDASHELHDKAFELYRLVTTQNTIDLRDLEDALGLYTSLSSALQTTTHHDKYACLAMAFNHTFSPFTDVSIETPSEAASLLNTYDALSGTLLTQFEDYMASRAPLFCTNTSTSNTVLRFLASRYFILQSEQQYDTLLPIRRMMVVEGPAGQGKDVITRGFLDANQIPYREPETQTVDDLKKTLKIAMQTGETVLLSDFSLPTAELEEVLNGILDDISQSGAKALFEPGFMIVVLKNPDTYEGRKPFSKALLSRAARCNIGHSNRDDLYTIVRRYAKVRGHSVDAYQIVDHYLDFESQLPDDHRSFRDFQRILNGLMPEPGSTPVELNTMFHDVYASYLSKSDIVDETHILLKKNHEHPAPVSDIHNRIEKDIHSHNDMTPDARREPEYIETELPPQRRSHLSAFVNRFSNALRAYYSGPRWLRRGICQSNTGGFEPYGPKIVRRMPQAKHDTRLVDSNPVQHTVFFDLNGQPYSEHSVGELRSWIFTDLRVSESGDIVQIGHIPHTLKEIEFMPYRSPYYFLNCTLEATATDWTPLPSMHPNNKHIVCHRRVSQYGDAFEHDLSDNFEWMQDDTTNQIMVRLKQASESGHIFKFNIGFIWTHRDSFTQPKTSQNVPLDPIFRNAIEMYTEHIPLLRELRESNMENEDKLIALFSYCQDFKKGEISEPLPAIEGVPDSVRDMMSSFKEQKGVCRHAAIAFYVMATTLGFNVRLVENEQHLFAEVENEDATWSTYSQWGPSAYERRKHTTVKIKNGETLKFRVEAIEDLYIHVESSEPNLRLSLLQSTLLREFVDAFRKLEYNSVTNQESTFWRTFHAIQKDPKIMTALTILFEAVSFISQLPEYGLITKDALQVAAERAGDSRDDIEKMFSNFIHLCVTQHTNFMDPETSAEERIEWFQIIAEKIASCLYYLDNGIHSLLLLSTVLPDVEPEKDIHIRLSNTIVGPTTTGKVYSTKQSSDINFTRLFQQRPAFRHRVSDIQRCNGDVLVTFATESLSEAEGLWARLKQEGIRHIFTVNPYEVSVIEVSNAKELYAAGYALGRSIFDPEDFDLENVYQLVERY